MSGTENSKLIVTCSVTHQSTRNEELNNFCEGCMPLKSACEGETADPRAQLHTHLKTPPTFLAQSERASNRTVVISGVILDGNVLHKSCSALHYALIDV